MPSAASLVHANLALAATLYTESGVNITRRTWKRYRKQWRYKSGAWCSKRQARILPVTVSALAALATIRVHVERDALELILTA